VNTYPEDFFTSHRVGPRFRLLGFLFLAGSMLLLILGPPHRVAARATKTEYVYRPNGSWWKRVAVDNQRCKPTGCAVTSEDGVNQSRLSLCLTIKNGKFHVDPPSSSLTPSKRFTSRSSISSDETRKILVQDLDAILDQMDYFYEYALIHPSPPDEPNPLPNNPTPEQQTQFDQDQAQYKKLDVLYQKLTEALNALENEEITQSLRQNVDWGGFKQQYAKWVNGDDERAEVRALYATHRVDLKSAYENLVKEPQYTNEPQEFNIDPAPESVFNTMLQGIPDEAPGLIQRLDETAITYDESDRDFTQFPGGAAGNGSTVGSPVICMKVTDPISADLVTQPNDEAKNIQSALDRLKSGLWRPTHIRSFLRDFYANRGLLMVGDEQFVLTAGDMSHPPKIKFLKAKVARIIIASSAAVDQTTIDKLLYWLLPPRGWKKYITDPKPAHFLKDFADVAGQGTGKFVVFNKGANHPGEHDELVSDEAMAFLLESDLAVAQARLLQNGFTLTFRPSGHFITTNDAVLDYKIDLIVTKAAATETQSANNNSTEKTSSAPSGPAPHGGRKNYLAGGINYRPGQGIGFIGEYDRYQLGPGQLGVHVGGQKKPLGAISYSADSVFFKKLHRDLSVSFTGSSDFEAQRIFSGIKTDERRTGGRAHAQLELSSGGSVLYAEGSRVTVALAQDSASVQKQNLTTVTVGGVFKFDRPRAARPFELRFEPRLRLGLGLGKTEPRFTAFLFAGHFREKLLPHLLEIDSTGRVALASRSTPLFDQPSLGGEDLTAGYRPNDLLGGSSYTVRGFRRDDAVGLRTWSLQNALLMPVPGFDSESIGKLHDFFQKLKIAAFVDIGGAYRTTGSKSGIRVGPGAGLRLDIKQAIISMDWGYGLGEGATGRGHGRFYFSLTPKYTF
jgi:hypothetical protein